jgi:hypothetical protein
MASDRCWLRAWERVLDLTMSCWVLVRRPALDLREMVMVPVAMVPVVMVLGCWVLVQRPALDLREMVPLVKAQGSVPEWVPQWERCCS